LLINKKADFLLGFGNAAFEIDVCW